MAKRLQKVRMGNGIHDVRSPQNVGAVIGLLCKLPFRQRLSICWLILRGPTRKMVKTVME